MEMESTNSWLPAQMDRTAGPATAVAPRRRLPARRRSLTRSFTIGGAEGYLTAGVYPDGQLAEVFLLLGKQGSTLAGLMDTFSVTLSVALQSGVPLETWVGKFINTRFEPSGVTDDPDIRIATSLSDYVVRRLALDFLPYATRAQYGVFTAEERARSLDGERTSADVSAVLV